MIFFSSLVRGWIDWTHLNTYSHVSVPIASAGVRAVFFAMAIGAMLKVKDVLEKEKRFGMVDYLTGLANTRAFHESVEREAGRCRRKELPLTIAFMDCDNFKAVNDKHGHKVGDEMLRIVAQIMRACLRGEDVTARMGGDEFAMALPEAGPEEANEILRRLHSQLTQAMQKHGWPVTFSMGAIVILHPAGSVDEMLDMADSEMYGVKKAGKDGLSLQVRT